MYFVFKFIYFFIFLYEKNDLDNVVVVDIASLDDSRNFHIIAVFCYKWCFSESSTASKIVAETTATNTLILVRNF